MNFWKSNAKAIWAAIISIIATGVISWFAYGTNMILNASEYQIQAKKIPDLELRMNAWEVWSKNQAIKDSLMIQKLTEKTEADRKQDEMIMALYKYLKIWTPEQSKIRTPERIKP